MLHMNLKLSFQIYSAAFWIVNGSRKLLCSQALQKKDSRSTLARVVKRRLFTSSTQRTSWTDFFSEAPISQEDDLTQSMPTGRPVDIPQRVIKEETPGWPSLEVYISHFDRSMSKRPYELGFRVFPAKDPVQQRKIEQHSRDAFQREFDKALDSNDPYHLLFWMLDAAVNNPSFLSDMDGQVFGSALRRLDPQYFIQPYQHVIPRNSPKFSNHRKSPHIISMFRQYTNAVLKLVHCRRASGCKIGLEEYRFLLKAAASARLSDSASHIWVAMLEDNVAPDISCYHALFKAVCFDGTHRHSEQVKVRLLPINSVLYRRHYTSHTGYKFGRGGIRDVIVYWYNHMCNRGLSPTAETYSLVMLALGRERKMDEVKRLVRGAWEIDLDEILDPREQTNTLSQARARPLIDPLCNPDPSTIRNLMLVLCSNNQIPEALKAVEHMANLYSMPVDAETWEELLGWSSTLFAPRTNRQIVDWKGYGIGQMDKAAIREVWATIQGEPYKAKPTLRMLDTMCSNAARRDSLKEILEYIRAGLLIYRDRLRRYLNLLQDLSRVVLRDNGKANARRSPKKSQYQLHHEVQVARAAEYEAFSTIQRWFVLVLQRNRWMGHGTKDSLVDWDRQVVPDLIQELWHFRPQELHYRPWQGELKTRTEDNSRGCIQFKAGESTLHEWHGLQRLLDALPAALDVEPGGFQTGILGYIKRNHDACRAAGIEDFIVQVLGPEHTQNPMIQDSEVHNTEVPAPSTTPDTMQMQNNHFASNICGVPA